MQGIKDQYIKEVQYECKDDAETQDVNAFLTIIYNNIAIVCQKMTNYNLSIKACDYALAVDDECEKSYFLRAQSRLAPLSSGAPEQDAAVKDLEKVLQINPKSKQAR